MDNLELKRKVKKETFDVKVQYCNPDECLHDCMLSGNNNCDSHKSTKK